MEYLPVVGDKQFLVNAINLAFKSDNEFVQDGRVRSSPNLIRSQYPLQAFNHEDATYSVLRSKLFLVREHAEWQRNSSLDSIKPRMVVRWC